MKFITHVPLVSIICLICGSLSAQALYEVYPLRGLKDVGDSGMPLFIRHDGVMAGSRMSSSMASIWTSPDVFIDTGILPGMNLSENRWINSHGVAVGRSWLQGQPSSQRAHIWSESEGVRPIPMPAGATSSHAFSINDRGLVAVQAHPRIYVWSELDGIRVLDLPAGATGTSGFEVSLNDHDDVGAATVIGGVSRATVWRQAGAPTLLGGVRTDRESTVRALNRHGDAVGLGVPESESVLQPLGWLASGSMYRLEIPTGQEVASALGLNSHREAVGWSWLNQQRQGAFWRPDGSVVRLDDHLAPGFEDWNIWLASSINDAGQIVGIANRAGVSYGVLLNPVPEPATLTMLGVGALALAFRRRKR